MSSSRWLKQVGRRVMIRGRHEQVEHIIQQSMSRSYILPRPTKSVLHNPMERSTRVSGCRLLVMPSRHSSS